MQGNADLFERFRSLLQEQRDNCDKEAALLRGWNAKSDGRHREQLQGQMRLLRAEVSDTRQAKEALVQQRRDDEIGEAIAKVDEAGRAISQLEAQLADGGQRRPRARVTAHAAEHRRAVSAAVDNSRRRRRRWARAWVVWWSWRRPPSPLCSGTRPSEPARRLLLLQRHRPMMARCYRAWRGLIARRVGARLAEGGAARDLRAQVAPFRPPWAGRRGRRRRRRRRRFVCERLHARDAGCSRGGVGAQEATAEGRHESVEEELRAAKALAAQAMRESEEQRARLDRQAAALASEGEAQRRSSELAREAERKALKEVATLRAKLQQVSSAEHLDAVRLDLERGAAERDADELRAQVAQMAEAHAAELGEMRRRLTAAEVERLRLEEEALARAREAGKAEHKANDAAAVQVAAARLEAPSGGGGRRSSASARRLTREASALRAELRAAVGGWTHSSARRRARGGGGARPSSD